MKRPQILVVGSMVMDLIVSMPRFPNAGEKRTFAKLLLTVGAA